MNTQNEVNLLELLNVTESSDQLLHSFLKIHDYEYNFQKDSEQIDIDELKSYAKLLAHLAPVLSLEQMSGFVLGFKLKDQANTQFDLLKGSNDTIINFEFKSETPSKPISKQASEHYRFLKMQYSRVIVIEYLADSDEIWEYQSQTKQMEPLNFDDLINRIPNASTGIDRLEKLTRSDFLVAPYNKPKDFLGSLYELTSNQKNIKTAIVKKARGASAITGGPGSGKTLLLLDIVRALSETGKSVGMVMGAKVGAGQQEVADALNIDIRWYYDLSSLEIFKDKDKDILIFDESQRIPKKFIEEALEIDDSVIKIFSVDEGQVVHPNEQQEAIQQYLEDSPMVTVFPLKHSVRINPGLVDFQKKLFDKRVKNAEYHEFENVSLRYFKSEKAAQLFIEMRNLEKVAIIEPDEFVTQQSATTKHPKKFPGSKNAKDVIGQEFENVLLIFDQYVNYDEGKLVFGKSEYYPYIDEKMIYQAITRASNSVEIIVINNQPLFIEIQKLLTRSRDDFKKKGDKIATLQSDIHDLKQQLHEAETTVNELKVQLLEVKS
ncbi:DNA/RNA helicase domain-containing protein [Periweissella cryptocerci]|uniref:DNA/RNA helicase domain-containing protein n=1 Tax=Periweissella cryptocerci TaxID=2506420 RepID=UPI0014043E73|nr:DNA/RNA helicase domain-containing protein [Periweissella cryptocerci]